MNKERWFGIAISEDDLSREASTRHDGFWGMYSPKGYAQALLDVFEKINHQIKCELRRFEKDGQKFICFAIASDAPNSGLPREPPPSDSAGYRNLRVLLNKRYMEWYVLDPEPEQTTLSQWLLNSFGLA